MEKLLRAQRLDGNKKGKVNPFFSAGVAAMSVGQSRAAQNRSLTAREKGKFFVVLPGMEIGTYL